MCRTQMKFDVLPVSSVENPDLGRFPDASVCGMPSCVLMPYHLQPGCFCAPRVRLAVPLLGVL